MTRAPRTAFQRLADDARAEGEPNLFLGVVYTCLIVVLGLAVATLIAAFVPDFRTWVSM